MAVRLSALRAGRPLPPGRFLVLISFSGWVDPRAIVRLEELGQFKIQWLIGTRYRGLPPCSIVPQPTALQRDPRSLVDFTDVAVRTFIASAILLRRRGCKNLFSLICNYVLPSGREIMIDTRKSQVTIQWYLGIRPQSVPDPWTYTNRTYPKRIFPIRNKRKMFNPFPWKKILLLLAFIVDIDGVV
jgi:hypothetical protein